MIGDLNVFSPEERRMLAATGERRFDNDATASANAFLFSTDVMAIAVCFSRRQFRDGAIHLLSPIHRCMTGQPAGAS